MPKSDDQAMAVSPCHCTTIRRATRRLSQLYDAVLEPSGLKATQRAILSQIGRVEASALSALADAMVMDRGALTHALHPLERDGLVCFTVDPQDRRSRRIALTKEGRKRLQQSSELWERAQRKVATAIAPKELEQLHRLLVDISSESFVERFSAAS